jgi:hypothetical protein
MPNGSQENPRPPSQFKKLFALARKVLYEERPSVKHIVQFFIEEGKGVKRGWALFTVVAIILSAGIWLAADHQADKKVTTLQIRFSSSNAFLLGRIDQLGDDVRKLQKTIDDNKTDFNETKREKDAEIAKLTMERDSAMQQKSQLESLPETALLTYSNANALMRNDPAAPDFRLMINGLSLTNYFSTGQYYFVPLVQNRDISFVVQKLKEGEYAVDNLTIDFLAALDATNMIADNRWEFQLLPFEYGGRTWNSWETISKHTVTSVKGFDVTTFSISTNFQEKALLSRVDIYAPRTRGVTQKAVVFLFQ